METKHFFDHILAQNISISDNQQSKFHSELSDDPRARIKLIENELDEDFQSPFGSFVGNYNAEVEINPQTSSVTSFSGLIYKNKKSPFVVNQDLNSESFKDEYNISNMAVNIPSGQKEAYLSMENEIELLNEELSDKAQIIRKLLSENTRLQEHQEETHELAILEFKQIVSNLEINIREHQKTIKNLEKKIDEEMNNNDVISERAQRLEDKIFSQENEIEILRKNSTNKEKIIVNLQKQLNFHIEDINIEDKENIKDLNNRNSKLITIVNKHESSISILKEELDFQAQDFNNKSLCSVNCILKLESENKNLQNLIAKLQDQIKDEQEKSESLEIQNSLRANQLKDEMTSRILMLLKEKQELEARIHDLEEPINTLEDTFESLHSEFSELGERTLSPRGRFSFNFEKDADLAVFSQEKAALMETVNALEKSLEWYRARFEESKLVDTNILRQELNIAEKQIIEAKLKYAEAETNKELIRKRLIDAKKKGKANYRSVLSRLFRRSNKSVGCN